MVIILLVLAQTVFLNLANNLLLLTKYFIILACQLFLTGYFFNQFYYYEIFTFLAFNGAVYKGIDSKSMSDEELEFAQQNLRILSGLYGLLRPLDLIQAYRLEMGTKIKIHKNKNLYHFWRTKITEQINKDLSGNNDIVNLASVEYFKAVNESMLHANIITPIFKDVKNGTYKVIMTYAKPTRGLMVNYIIKNAITEPEQLKNFTGNNYVYNKTLSDEKTVFF